MNKHSISSPITCVNVYASVFFVANNLVNIFLCNQMNVILIIPLFPFLSSLV
jgi:hypothetical protein